MLPNVAANLTHVAIVGPTAVGKSEVAVRLAAAVAQAGSARSFYEIIGCDSVQVYRRFDLGSAKPSQAQRQEVAHHLIDVIDWQQSFDAFQYAEQARAHMADIERRGGCAIVCGGTGLYLHALRFGLLNLPAVDQALRDSLQQRWQTDPSEVYAELTRLDPVAAASLRPQARTHVLRALEICLQTGQAISDLRARHRAQTVPLALRVMALGLPAEILRQRISQRTEQMMRAGLLAETTALLDAGVSPACRPMGAVGYRQCREHLLNGEPLAGLADRIAHSTWLYARRQRTWLRREPGIEHIDAQSAVAAVADIGHRLGCKQRQP